MQDLTLVIMAAGMGSRYGGLKQIEPIGPNGEFMIDYSIYDALKAGFNKVVFIIKKENYDIFRETVGSRVEGKIAVEYAFQDINDLPAGYQTPEDRTKPWGTVQAILAARDLVKENFAIINADDFYGEKPYQIIADFFKENKSDTEFVMPPYKASDTLAEAGAVKRAICKTENEYLVTMIESLVERNAEGEIIASPLDGRTPFPVTDDTFVSMNTFGFTPQLFTLLERDFTKFLEENKLDLSKCEFLISEWLEQNLANGEFTMKVVGHNGQWYGITFQEDRPILINAIREYIDKGIYPENLWDSDHK